jgi:hypothetical protein
MGLSGEIVEASLKEVGGNAANIALFFRNMLPAYPP